MGFKSKIKGILLTLLCSGVGTGVINLLVAMSIISPFFAFPAWVVLAIVCCVYAAIAVVECDSSYNK
jgi:hypothetical protein